MKNIVKHSLYLTENAIESNLFPEILLLMAHSDESIRNYSAQVIREVVQHSVQVQSSVFYQCRSHLNCIINYNKWISYGFLISYMGSIS